MGRGLAAGSLAEMGFFLLLLIFFPVRGDFEGTCPRIDPPPGVLVLSLGSKLFLTCDGHVEVDGVKRSLAGSSAGINKRESSSNVTPATQKDLHNSAVSAENDSSSTKNAVSEPRENRSLVHTDAGYTESRLLKDKSNCTAEDMDVKDDNEEGEGESRVTRGIKPRPEWKWNKMALGTGNRDGGGTAFRRSGYTVCLPSLRPTDTGKYACYHRGKETFGVKVFVAESLASPEMFCYKKSPSSKIRCEWRLQKTLNKQPSCSLFLNKSPKESFRQLPCSYSAQQSRCSCALEYNGEERLTFHLAYMCFTSITANATSPLLQFTPMGILKPDPPSNVSVRQEEGRDGRPTVSWDLPATWKFQDNYYKLIYEVKYKPSLGKEQIIPVVGKRYEQITDMMLGVEYLIQVRTKEEFERQWSDWSAPVYARSWTSKYPHPPSVVLEVEDGGQETMTVTCHLPAHLKEQHNFNFSYELKYWPVNSFFPEEVRQFEGECSYTITDVIPDVEYVVQLRFKKEPAGQWSDWTTAFHSTIGTYSEGSSGDNDFDNVSDIETSIRFATGMETSPSNGEWVYHVLWISGLFMLLSVILAIYICRHGDRLMSKFCSLYFTTHYGDSSQPSPSIPAAPEARALVAFAPTESNKEQPHSDEKESEENEEQEILKERMELMHFNNASYFILQRA